ncbi:MAG: putative metallopeptidase [Candidatus Omnitrophica bacterium]|nr:putative metallopeptidase [Candidatus Omnitrophota bacterium]
MKVGYTDADKEVMPFIAEGIRIHHTHLANARIKAIFREKHMSSKGRTVAARAIKSGAIMRYLAGIDFIIEVAQDVWMTVDDKMHKAIIDHELCHCGWDNDKNEPYIIPHDLEEFSAIVERHGLWCKGLQTFGAAVQLSLNVGSLGKNP